ncbi:methyl-accepting chemotaxis protein [Natrarchaeobaculum aegyptiacum]|uniref:Chemotaxis protein n=1 Tax=Natrarchaeobaculum aegyptiacum TaxID=745377 RepID=A0A2Z2HS53_9EURY|nr:methyl-accepting chemotaxis protein [Natrarchaeobaculum aegyptiacum]ARS90026.1 hypothetical protein B1756_09995 [Natrarchaeobaculum aegyptiacum]
MADLFRKLVPRFIRRSYALKFAIALVVLGVAIGGVGLAGTMLVHDGVQTSVSEDHGTLALQQSQAVGAFHDDNVQTLETVARSSALEADSETVQEYVQTETSNRGGGGVGQLHFHVLETDGEVLASSKVSPGGELQGDWVGDLDEREGTYVTDAYRSGGVDGSEPRVAYVTDSGDVPDGQVLVYTVPLSDYPVSSADATHTVVVDGSGTVAFDETWSAVLESYDEDDAPIRAAGELSTSDAGGMEVEQAGGFLTDADVVGTESYVVGYSTVPGTDWVALVHTSTAEAYGFADDVMLYGSLATIVAVALVGAVGAVIGWNTSRSIDRLTSKAARMEEGDLDVDLESPRIDSIGRLYDGFDSMRWSLKDQIREATEARDEAETAQAETERINRHLESKAQEYREVMQTCATGDLTARMDPDSDNEAMTEIATEFNEMIAELEATTAAVKSFAREVATASEEVTASNEEVHSASVQVSESIQEISAGADRQNDQMQAVTGEMEDLSTTTEEIAASSDQVADIAERTAKTGRQGRQAAQEAIEGLDAIESDSEAAVEEIDRLAAEVEQIDDLLEFITEVAEQTNMLALNANIEASRSGESNEGFAAVAGEVKELAAETKSAANDIEQRLARIQSQTDQTAEAVQESSERVTEHSDSIERAAEALEEIAGYATETNVGVQEISAATDQQAASVQEVVAMADEVATIAEETSAESETVAAAAEEQTTALTEVSRSASTLAGQAAQLSESLEHFETDPDAGAEVDLASAAAGSMSEEDDEPIALPDPSGLGVRIGGGDGGDGAEVDVDDGIGSDDGMDSVTDDADGSGADGTDSDDADDTDAADEPTMFQFDEGADDR